MMSTKKRAIAMTSALVAGLIVAEHREGAALQQDECSNTMCFITPVDYECRYNWNTSCAGGDGGNFAGPVCMWTEECPEPPDEP
jgi:hypothetical protein